MSPTRGAGWPQHTPRGSQRRPGGRNTRPGGRNNVRVAALVRGARVVALVSGARLAAMSKAVIGAATLIQDAYRAAHTRGPAHTKKQDANPVSTPVAKATKIVRPMLRPQASSARKDVASILNWLDFCCGLVQFLAPMLAPGALTRTRLQRIESRFLANSL